MCEYRSFAYLEFSTLLSIYFITSEIWWKEIRGKWYSSSIKPDYSCKSTNSASFAESRNSFEEGMSTCEECDKEFFYDYILSDDFFLDLLLDLRESIMDMSESRIHREIIWKIGIFAKKKRVWYIRYMFTKKVQTSRGVRVFFDVGQLRVWASEWLKISENTSESLKIEIPVYVPPKQVSHYEWDIEKSVISLWSSDGLWPPLSLSNNLNDSWRWLRIETSSGWLRPPSAEKMKIAELDRDEAFSKVYTQAYLDLTASIEKYKIKQELEKIQKENIDSNLSEDGKWVEISQERLGEIQQQAINKAGEFMREYGVKIKDLIALPWATPEDINTQITAWRKEFFSKNKKQEIENISEENEKYQDIDPTSRIDNSLFDVYSQTQVEHTSATQEYIEAVSIYDKAVLVQADPKWEKNQAISDQNNPEFVWPRQQPETLDTSTDTRTAVSQVESIASWESKIFHTDGGDMSVMSTTDGKYVFQMGDGEYMICDKGELVSTIPLLQECMQTPLVRRLMAMGDTAFDMLRQRIQTKYDPSGESKNNPQLLVKYILSALFDIALGSKEQLWEWIDAIPRWVFERRDIPLDMMQSSLSSVWSIQKKLIGDELDKNGVFDREQRKFNLEALLSRI